ncbi:MAG: hypothetical protein O7E54_10835 [Planctomycetota bacterium]|nr:hypothetical protein [Planctomycetota bacterium]
MRLRSLVLLGLPFVLAGRIAAEPETPPPDQRAIEQALEDLKLDQTDDSIRALEVLARANSFQTIADYGVTTQHVRLTLVAAQHLADAGPDVARKELVRLQRTQKKRRDGLVRVALMAEIIPGNVSRSILLGLIKHKRTEVALTAIRSLGIRKEQTARAPLHALLKSKRAPVAAAAAFALAQLPHSSETNELLFKRVVRAEKAKRVGDACAVALQRMPVDKQLGERALALLAKRASAFSVHALTKVAVRHARDPDPDSIIRLVRAGNPRAREIGCDIAGYNKMKHEAVQKELIRLASTEHDWRVRIAAWLALTRTGIEHVVDDVKTNIRKKGEHSYWAIQCAGRDPHDELLLVLREAALDTDDHFRRKLAQRALRNAGKKSETRAFFLAEYTKGPTRRQATAALLGLGNLKDQDSFHLLVDLLEKVKQKRIKIKILKGLEVLTGHYFEPDAAVWNEWYQVVEGKVSWDPKKIDRAKNRERIRKSKAFGISRKTDEAVERGLRWLSLHQDITGGWNGATFHEHCPNAECRADGGHRDRPLAYTALSILAFQGAGYDHLTGPYRNNIQRGFEFILTNVDYDGSHYDRTWTFSYEAAITCQALCDAYALSGDHWIGMAGQRSIDYMTKIQFPGKNWRYHIRAKMTDTSVMSWVLTGMVSARHAGLDIPDQIFVAADAWLDIACDPIPPDTYEVFVRTQYDKKERYAFDVRKDKRGKVRTYKLRTWYQPPRLYTPAMSSIGVLCRIWLGWTRAHPFCIGCANTVVDNIPGYGSGLEKTVPFYPYTWYYGALAMYQMGGKYWQRWREKCIRAVLDNQKRGGHLDGAWTMPQTQYFGGLTGGRIYCTVMCILTLESFYRYQPYLARHDVRSRVAEAEEDGKKKKVVPGLKKK